MTHIDWDEDRRLILKSLPGDFWIVPVLETANIVFYLLLSEVDSFADLGIDEKIESFTADFEERARQLGVSLNR